MKKDKNVVQLFGCDAGSGETKASLLTITSDGLHTKEAKFPSYVQNAPFDLETLSTDADETVGQYFIRNEDWTVGHPAFTMPQVGDKRLTYSRAALVKHALVKVGVAEQSRLIMSLAVPTSYFYIRNGRKWKSNQTLIEQIKESIISSLPEYDFMSIDVFPEALPPFYHHFMDSHGSRRDSSNITQDLLLIDIGQNTTDIAIIQQDNNKIGVRYSTLESFENAGVGFCYAQIKENIILAFAQQDVNISTLSELQLQKALEYHELNINGVTVTCDKIIKHAKNNAAAYIRNIVAAKVAKLNFDVVMFAGGGPSFFGAKNIGTSWFSQPVQILDNMSCSRGLRIRSGYKSIVLANESRGKQPVNSFVRALEVL